MFEELDASGYMTGQLLIAMPNMADPRFARTVIYLCAHSEQGAMGLVINKPMPQITFVDLLEQLDIVRGSGNLLWCLVPWIRSSQSPVRTAVRGRAQASCL